MKFLIGLNGPAYASLRIVSGLLFLSHGVQKFFNFPAPFPMKLNPLLTSAGIIELVAGTLIMIGFATRPAAFIASGMAAVGYWLTHATKGIYPITNGGETIALYCFVFLFIATQGPGIWSVSKK